MHSGHRERGWEHSPALPCRCLQITFVVGLGCKATFAQLVQPQTQRKPTGCRTNLPLGPSSLCKPSSLPAPTAPHCPPQSLPHCPPGPVPVPLPPKPSPPETHRRSQSPPANSQQSPAFPGKRGGKKKTMTSRAGLFGFVCLLVGSIKYSWKVNVPHTGEV